MNGGGTEYLGNILTNGLSIIDVDLEAILAQLGDIGKDLSRIANAQERRAEIEQEKHERKLVEAGTFEKLNS